jgi:hypothetical protein
MAALSLLSRPLPAFKHGESSVLVLIYRCLELEEESTDWVGVATIDLTWKGLLGATGNT